MYPAHPVGVLGLEGIRSKKIRRPFRAANEEGRSSPGLKPRAEAFDPFRIEFSRTRTACPAIVALIDDTTKHLKGRQRDDEHEDEGMSWIHRAVPGLLLNPIKAPYNSSAKTVLM
jgi:hypothetical protein